MIGLATAVFVFICLGMIITQGALLAHVRKIQQGLTKTFGYKSLDELYAFFDQRTDEDFKIEMFKRNLGNLSFQEIEDFLKELNNYRLGKIDNAPKTEKEKD